MSYTLFVSPGIKAWKGDVDDPISSVSMPHLQQITAKHPMLTFRHETFTMAALETRSILPILGATEWMVVYLLVNGKVSLATTGVDTNGSTPITGATWAYGTAYLPGLLALQTYNLSAAVLTAETAATVEMLTGIIAASTDARL